MCFQVLANLLFSFGHKAQAPFVSRQPSGSAQSERHGVPERVKQGRPALQFRQPRFAPSQMISFLGGGLIHGLPNLLKLGCAGLPRVKRLSAHFPGVIDAHKACGMLTLSF